MEEPPTPQKKQSFSLYVMSGGVGASGEQLARTVLAQFQNASVDIEVFPKISTKLQVQKILQNASMDGAVIAHTFVDPKLRRVVKKTAKELDLVAIDLVGPLIETLSEKLNQEPIGKPGLYRQLYQSYFDRIDAMDYTLAHDDGKHPQGWQDAEIILISASRVGKTPISLYLSVLGWQVANIPLLAGISPGKEFFDLDMRRVIGLTIAPSELIEHRKHRQSQLGVVGGKSDYIDPTRIFQELEAIELFFRQNRIPIIDVTGKPIESSADEVIRLLRRKLKGSPK